jgi:hypothetical protein
MQPETIRAIDSMAIEAVELFGIMPANDNYVAKYIMLAHEICRTHMYTRKDDAKSELQVFIQNDFRNAHRVIKKMLRRFPTNPYVLSKAGIFYLEIGNKMEASIHFSKVRTMLQEMTKKLQAQ